jgi:predicted GTPase
VDSRDTIQPRTPSPISLPSSVDEFVSLVKRPKERDELEGRQYEQILPYVRSSLVVGRHLNRAVILILGVSGHGKSKTINTLVGRDILSVAKSSDGSITEVYITISLSLTIFS